MIYKIQIDNEVRDATPAEAATIEVQRKAAAETEAALETKQAAAASARAKLAKLGLTDDEVAALLGG